MSLNKRYKNSSCLFEFKLDAIFCGSMSKVAFSYTHKIIFFILSMFFLLSCNSESAPNCFQRTGRIVRKEVNVSDFSKITVFDNVSMVLKQGDLHKVEVETGEFLLEDITTVVEGNRLVLKNTNHCNYFRDYGNTKIYVTSPNIIEIRSSTGLTIESNGVLNYSSLDLIAESFTNNASKTTDGFFDLQIGGKNLSILSNGIAYFKLRGNVENLNVFIAAGDSRIEAEKLVAEFVTINHRGTNDMFVNPQKSLRGVIRGIGDAIIFNRPDIIEVEKLFKGQLIFK